MRTGSLVIAAALIVLLTGCGGGGGLPAHLGLVVAGARGGPRDLAPDALRYEMPPMSVTTRWC